MLVRQGHTSPRGNPGTDAVQLVATVAAVMSIAAGVIHVSAAGDHTNLPVMLWGFVVVAALQIGLGLLLLVRRPSRPLIGAGIALMVGAIGMWVLSRTAGLPFLEDGHRESIGAKDGITVMFELASIPALLLLLSPELEKASLPARLREQTRKLLAAGSFALLVPALLLGGGEHHSHEQAVELGLHADDHAGDVEAAHADSGSSHSRNADKHHADRDNKERGQDKHKHAGSTDGGSHHGNVELASSTLGTGHGHAGPDSEPRHHRKTGDGRNHPKKHGRDRDRNDGNHHGGGHGDDHAGGDGAGDQPSGPLEDVVADVVGLLPPNR